MASLDLDSPLQIIYRLFTCVQIVNRLSVEILSSGGVRVRIWTMARTRMRVGFRFRVEVQVRVWIRAGLELKTIMVNLVDM